MIDKLRMLLQPDVDTGLKLAAVAAFFAKAFESTYSRLTDLEARQLEKGDKGDPGPKGKDGKDGRDGVSVVDAEIDGHQLNTFSSWTFRAKHFAARTLVGLFGSSATLKYWDGGAWTAKPLMRWNGASWVSATLKRYDGGSWA